MSVNKCTNFRQIEYQSMNNNFYVSGAQKNLKYLPDHDHIPMKQHKSHIDKVMVASALSQPIFNDNESEGLIVHGDFILAQRQSVNRERGTIELH